MRMLYNISTMVGSGGEPAEPAEPAEYWQKYVV